MTRAIRADERGQLRKGSSNSCFFRHLPNWKYRNAATLLTMKLAPIATPMPISPSNRDDIQVRGYRNIQNEMILRASTWYIAPDARTIPLSTKLMPRNG